VGRELRGGIRARDQECEVTQRSIQRKAFSWFRQADEFHQAGKLEAALPLYKKVLKAEPNHWQAMFRLGLICWQIRDFDRAQRCLMSVIARKPDFPHAHYNLGVVYEEQGRVMQALASYQEAIRLKPDFGDAWEGLGKALHALGNPEDAVRCYDKALAVSPPHGTATAERRYNSSYSLMALGRWKEGWESYEARFQSPVFLGNYVLDHHEPAWDGLPLEGRRLLVHAEQGFGDSMMMARYLPLIEGDVVIEVQAPLVRLFQESFPTRHIVAQGEEHPRCDCQVAMMSLAHRFGMTAENVPTDPWLKRPWNFPGPELPAGDGLKVGYVWSGNPQHRNQKRRSIDLEHWKPLFAVEGVSWYSLQVDETSLHGHQLKPLIKDFADTAALIAQLDLVICCDTAVAHLAGALGKPVWVMLPTIPDYRWGLQSNVTCWYPTMQLVRQEAAGAWEGVMREIAEGLELLLQARAGS
jgi:hypothetical protein